MIGRSIRHAAHASRGSCSYANVLATDDDDDVLPRAFLGLLFRPTHENVAGPVHSAARCITAAPTRRLDVI